MPRVVISLDETALQDIDETVAALRRAGLSVDDVLRTTGVVTGSIDGTRVLADLRSVSGVRDVEQERGYDVGPPDSEVQ
ncbi:hypothetical protein EV193_102421 [Herbihabitans rhizosphaerae]|uniref:Ketohydroxyglutarate aldolase n=1 Tax=Herbihabitans rhizosphaerae TaxID=1872711 RepID=A0A4Q7L4L0_9PSEU|nr:hypothetical protein [Herbihabitans rhizosphaerae]RZS43441.1 hypothetical protein EV193_102421 [Herbihabitans rhizosphaerae]